MSKVSLILPAYKARRDWLEQCLNSIKAQTYKDIELILIDGVKGAWKARNEGLDQATGDYIAFCDADDYLEPDAIEKMVKAMHGASMVCGSFRKFGDFEMEVSHYDQVLEYEQVAEYALANLLNPRKNQMLSGCWAKLYKRNMVGRFPELTTAEDMAFNFNYLRSCELVHFIPDVVYHNRKHANSLTTTYDESDRQGLFGFLEGLKQVRQYLLYFYTVGEVEDALDNSKIYHAALYFSRIAKAEETFKRLWP